MVFKHEIKKRWVTQYFMMKRRKSIIDLRCSPIAKFFQTKLIGLIYSTVEVAVVETNRSDQMNANQTDRIEKSTKSCRDHKALFNIKNDMKFDASQAKIEINLVTDKYKIPTISSSSFGFGLICCCFGSFHEAPNLNFYYSFHIYYYNLYNEE